MRICHRNAALVFAVVFLGGIVAAILWWPTSQVSPSLADKPLPASNSLAVVGTLPTNALSPPSAEILSGQKQSGSVTQGTLVTLAAARQTQGTSPPQVNRSTREARVGPAHMFQEFLGLTDEQATHLQPILKAQQKQLAELRANPALSRQERVAKLKEMRQTADAQIKQLLTPQQAEKWQKRRLSPLTSSHGQQQRDTMNLESPFPAPGHPPSSEP